MTENAYVNGFATMTENAMLSEIARDIDFALHGKDASLIENT